MDAPEFMGIEQEIQPVSIFLEIEDPGIDALIQEESDDPRADAPVTASDEYTHE
jgi:hypothetical protein